MHRMPRAGSWRRALLSWTLRLTPCSPARALPPDQDVAVRPMPTAASGSGASCPSVPPCGDEQTALVAGAEPWACPNPADSTSASRPSGWAHIGDRYTILTVGTTWRPGGWPRSPRRRRRDWRSGSTPGCAPPAGQDPAPPVLLRGADHHAGPRWCRSGAGYRWAIGSRSRAVSAVLPPRRPSPLSDPRIICPLEFDLAVGLRMRWALALSVSGSSAAPETGASARSSLLRPSSLRGAVQLRLPAPEQHLGPGRPPVPAGGCSTCGRPPACCPAARRPTRRARAITDLASVAVAASPDSRPASEAASTVPAQVRKSLAVKSSPAISRR